MLKAVVGHSNDPDTAHAIAEVLAQCTADLEGHIPSAGILFAAPDFEHQDILDQIYGTFPDLQLIGGTTDGEISSVLQFQQDSLALILFCSDTIEFQAAVGRHISSNPVAIATQTAQQTLERSQQTINLCITTPESLTTSGLLILQGLQQAFGTKIPIVGGTTCDQLRFEQTYQFYNNEVLSDSLPILTLAGSVLVGFGVASGWTPIGKKGVVTEVSGNVLHKINDQPVLDFYREYHGDLRPSLDYRLAVFEANRDSWYMRTSNGTYDSSTGSITFFADIPAQAEVQAVRSTRDEMIQSVGNSLEQALAFYPGSQPDVALFFSCTGRLNVLGTRAEEEYKSLLPKFAPNLTCAGFYTYGEIAPLRRDGASQFHNETFVTLLLGVQ